MVKIFNSWIVLLIVFGSLIAVNLISQKRFIIQDITESKYYSLSKTTKKILSSVDDRITVKLFFSRKLPAMYSNLTSKVKDILKDFSAYSNGNIRVLAEDNSNMTRFKSEAKKFSIPAVRLSVMKMDNYEAIHAYLGIVFLYKDRMELLPVIDPTILRNLEYKIMVLIKRLLENRKKTVAFLTGHEEADIEKDIVPLKKVLMSNYNVVSYKISEGKPIDPKIDCLLVVAPKKDFSIWDKFAVDQFIMAGKKAAFFIDSSVVRVNEGFGHNLNTNIPEWLLNYGIEILQNIIIDKKCSRIEIKQNRGEFSTVSEHYYPYFPEVSDFSNTNKIVLGIHRLGLKFVSSLEFKSYPGIEIETVARTSQLSGVVEAPYFVGFDKKINEDEYKSGSQVVVAAVKGHFKSAFAGKYVTFQATVDKKIDSSGFEIRKYTGTVIDKSKKNRIVFVGDGDLFSGKMGIVPENIHFGQNVVDWLTQSVDMISIRTKEIKFRGLKKIPNHYKALFKYGNIIAPPIIIVLLSILVSALKGLYARKIHKKYSLRPE